MKRVVSANVRQRLLLHQYHGEQYKLISMIVRKMKKGKEPVQIAAELDEEDYGTFWKFEDAGAEGHCRTKRF